MEFIERYKRICPDFSTEVQVRPALRLNTLRDGAVLDRLRARAVALEQVPFLADGHFYEADFSLGALPEYLLGLYYLQSPLSQLAVEVLDPRTGECVLDMAAAPGSKTTHCAQRMRNEGLIVALDTNALRLDALRNNCERLGVLNVVALRKDGRFAADLATEFDRVLLDAPCAGSFCAGEEWFAQRRIPDLQRNARLQRELLLSAASVLKRGGTLVYSTCSLEPEENECVVDWLLKKRPELHLASVTQGPGDPGITAWEGKELDQSLHLTRRFWPHKTSCEGFFIAKLVKN